VDNVKPQNVIRICLSFSLLLAMSAVAASAHADVVVDRIRQEPRNPPDGGTGREDLPWQNQQLPE